MTKTEVERLAVVESQIVTLQQDVTEIKTDVKSLVATQASLAIALAAKNAAEEARTTARASTGTWVRSVIPWVITGAGVAVALMSYLQGS